MANGREWTLYTIGYGGLTPAQLVDVLRRFNIPVLVDVRYSPRTRIPGFNRVALEKFCATQGLTYLHVQSLGNERYKTDGIKLVNQDDGLMVLAHKLSELGDVAIMCACRVAAGCHRSYIAKAMVESYPLLKVVDL